MKRGSGKTAPRTDAGDEGAHTMAPDIVTDHPLTQYVIHRGDSYVRLAQQGGRTLAAMVRDPSEATVFRSFDDAVIAALWRFGREWAIETVKGQN